MSKLLQNKFWVMWRSPNQNMHLKAFLQAVKNGVTMDRSRTVWVMWRPPNQHVHLKAFLQAVKNGVHYGQKSHGDVGHVPNVAVHLNTSILHDVKRRMQQTGPAEFLQFLHPHSSPSPSSKEFSDFANDNISEVVKLWGSYLKERGHSVSGAEF